MTPTEQDTAVRLEIVVDVPQHQAFTVFTEQFDVIKPRDHNLLPVEIAESVFETHVGGHVYDRGVDGSVCRWARVLAFDPPERFVISWDIDLHWRLEPNPERCSEVEVRFIPLGADRTRVELCHRHLDRHGDGWPRFRSALTADNAWPIFLRRFEKAAMRR